MRLFIIAALISGVALAATPTAGEVQEASQWVAQYFSKDAKVLPFSFVYGGKASAELLPTWPVKSDQAQTGGSWSRSSFIWTDPKTRLEVRCVAVQYLRWPVIEWTVYFKNTGNANTPIIENIQGLDIRIERAEGAEFVLHQHRGDYNAPESYQPFSEPLMVNSSKTSRPAEGRATDSSFPYYNLQMPGGGLIAAVGWPGQWATKFERDSGRGLRFTAGQDLTHLYLKPGEEIRTPLIALLFWKGTDTMRAQNVWRSWMLAHNLPRPGGKLPAPLNAFCDGAYFPGLKVSEAGEKQFIDAFTREHIKLDYWWIDAGWYPCRDNWQNTGTWEPDPERFPRGIKAVSDYVHARGIKLVLWFEPERASAGSWLALNHPEWLLGGKLFNMGNAEARQWMTEHVDRLIREQGVDLYRQDFNIEPLGFWRKNDAADRQGATENFHVQGYLAYWDELRRRHPNMLIDSCSGGGRRNDLETMRRAVPLLRSDYQAFDGNPGYAIGNQGHTYGISSWLPYYGQGVYITAVNAAYYARSHMSPSFSIAVDVRKPGIDWDLYRRLVSQWRDVADCMLGDYYPLTPYSLENDRWIAWQFDRLEQGDGMVQAFRRDASGEPSMSFRLHALEPGAQYEVTDVDAGTPKTFSGRELLERGLAVAIDSQPGSVVVKYKKIKL
jgi:alpha-galactosidase